MILGIPRFLNGGGCQEASTLKAWRDNNNQQRHTPPAPPKKLSDFERKQRLQERFSNQATQSAFKKVIDGLTNQELLYLEQAVKEYFSETVAQVPPPIDRPTIESQISQLQQQLDSLWIKHTQQEKSIRTMELIPLHQLSNKYELMLNQQLETIGTIKELFTQKQQLELDISQWEIQVQKHETWKREPKTIEMSTIYNLLKTPQLQERLTTIKETQKQREREVKAKLTISRQPSPQPRRGFRR
ncbi:hypothetical protein [Anabaena cylindrica]|uniref:hypothetical protein n=1 Tax=Anabaena cylindrica TaxID=1165 RepID=UPI001F54AC0C|nr:hypothetical protein [Anabaena cylindrica]